MSRQQIYETCKYMQIPSIYGIFIFIYIYLIQINYINVGKYTSPMDGFLQICLFLSVPVRGIVSRHGVL